MFDLSTLCEIWELSEKRIWKALRRITAFVMISADPGLSQILACNPGRSCDPMVPVVPLARLADTRRLGFRVATLSEPRRRALSILHRYYPLAPAIFAHYMWPASKSWIRPHRAGCGIRLKARTFLAGLERDGLARRCGVRPDAAAGYVLTDWGESVTDAAPRPNRLS